MSRSFRSRSRIIGSVAGCLAEVGLGAAAGEIGQRAIFNNSTSDFGRTANAAVISDSDEVPIARMNSP